MKNNKFPIHLFTHARTVKRTCRFFQFMYPAFLTTVLLDLNLYAVPEPPLWFAGLQHTPLGQASLEVRQDQLRVKNLGESGLDGVRLTFGMVDSARIAVDTATAGLAPVNGMCIDLLSSSNTISHSSFTRLEDRSIAFKVDFAASLEVTTIAVEVRRSGNKLAAEEMVHSAAAELLHFSQGALDRFLYAYMTRLSVNTGPCMVLMLEWTTPVEMSMAGRNYQADTVIIIPKLIPEWEKEVRRLLWVDDYIYINITTDTLTTNGLSEIIISDETVGLNFLPHRAVGEAHLRGTTNGLEVSNIGVSGNDGVEVILPADLTLWHASIDTLGTGSDLPNGAFLRVTARGTIGEAENRIISVAQYEKVSEGVRSTIEFPELSATGYRSEFYREGELVRAMDISRTWWEGFKEWICSLIPDSFDVSAGFSAAFDASLDWNKAASVTLASGETIATDYVRIMATNEPSSAVKYSRVLFTASQVPTIKLIREVTETLQPVTNNCPGLVLNKMSSYPTSSYAGVVEVSGTTAYVASQGPFGEGGEGIMILDVSNPIHPVLLGTMDPPGWIWDLCAVGNKLYAAAFDAGLVVLDISNPSQPSVCGNSAAAPRALGVEVVGPYAFVADGIDGLLVFDVSNPCMPVLVGATDTPGDAIKVSVAGNYAYVADFYAGLTVVNVTDPGNPTVISSRDTSGMAVDVAVDGNALFLADESGIFQQPLGEGLVVFDITTPAQPQKRGNYAATGTIYGVNSFVSGKTVAVAFGDLPLTPEGAGVLIVDVRDPEHPQCRAVYDIGDPHKLCVRPPYVYVANWLRGFAVLKVQYPPISIQGSGNTLVVSWDDAPDILLETATNLIGPWTEMPTVNGSCNVAPENPQQFFRLRQR